MLLFAVVDTIVVVLLILWLLKKKQGEKFSKKFVIKALGFGALAVIAGLLVGFVLPADGIPGIEDPLPSAVPVLHGILLWQSPRNQKARLSCAVVIGSNPLAYRL